MEDHPEIKLFDTGLNHPSARGSYLMACVIYATIFKEALENVEYYFTLAEEDALYLQPVSSALVLENLALWYIT